MPSPDTYVRARARVLLKAAGFTPGSDGIMRNAAGQRLTVEFRATSGNPLRERIALLIQQQLQQDGFEANIQNYPPRVFFGEMVERRRFKAMAMFAWALARRQAVTSITLLTGFPARATTWLAAIFQGSGMWRWIRYVRQSRGSWMEGRRKALLQASARIFSRELPALPLYYRVEPSAVKHGLEDGASARDPTWLLSC